MTRVKGHDLKGKRHIRFSRSFQRCCWIPREWKKDCSAAVQVNINLSTRGLMCQIDKRNNLKRQTHTMLLNSICDFYDQLRYLKSLLSCISKNTSENDRVWFLFFFYGKEKSNFIVAWIFLYKSFTLGLPYQENCGFPMVPYCYRVKEKRLTISCKIN